MSVVPDYFWEWYKEKGYDRVLDMQGCFNNRPFIVGCCIEYLSERGQKINDLNECDDFEEMFDYLRTGVAWTSPKKKKKEN